MQVNQVADHISHAVIGKAQARDFGISQSAEFFNILSNTLYSDKILAVVREVLCNAWDIHIQTGKTNVPVEVILKDGYLTITDHGTGIHDDNIHEIYAVYGNSTKKLDGTQTGGFGLGSKAPFAYVDHFEVTSRHDGKKTIYAISKSSAEVAGKPSIMPLVSVPYDEDDTGLTVKLSIKREDVNRFIEVIKNITRFGEMNVNLTTMSSDEPEKLKTLPFSEVQHGFLMVQEIDHSQNQIFVRYGNVIYPITPHEKISALLSETSRLIKSVGEEGYYRNLNWKLVLQADPDTISVTPSRESLSMTDHTIDTLYKLLNNFLNTNKDTIVESCIDIERDCIEKAIAAGHSGRLLTDTNKIPRQDTSFTAISPIKRPSIITNARQMAESLMSCKYPDFKDFNHQDLLMRLEALEKNNFGGTKNKGKIQSFRREYLRQYENGKDDKSSYSWFQKTIVGPIVRKLDEVPELMGQKLLAYGSRLVRTRYDDRGSKFCEVKDIPSHSMSEYLPFLRNIIVLSFNRMDVEERLPSFPEFRQEKLGDCSHFFVYVVSRNETKAKIAREFFENLGVTLLDLTKAQSWERQEVIKPVPKPKITKPRKKGLPLLSNILTSTGKIDYTRFQPSDDAYEGMKRTETPEYVVEFNPRAQSARLFHRHHYVDNKTVVDLYGDRGAVTTNSNQTSRFTDQGIPELEEWLFEELLRELERNEPLQKTFGYDQQKIQSDPVREIMSSFDKKQIFDIILNNPDLAIEFDVLNETTYQDHQISQIIRSFDQYRLRYGNPPEREIYEFLQQIQIEPEVEDLAERIANSNLVSILDTDKIKSLFKRLPEGTKENPEIIQKRSAALDVIQYVLS